LFKLCPNSATAIDQQQASSFVHHTMSVMGECSIWYLF